LEDRVVTGILLCCAAILLLVGALYLILCHEPLVAAWWYRLFRDPEPYSSQFADAPEVGPGILRARPDPVDDVHDNYQRAAWFTDAGVPIVPGRHPADCTEKCCFEIRLTELHDAFDWGGYECEMGKTK